VHTLVGCSGNGEEERGEGEVGRDTDQQQTVFTSNIKRTPIIVSASIKAT